MPTERPPLVEEVVPTFGNRGCCMVSATDSHITSININLYPEPNHHYHSGLLFNKQLLQNRDGKEVHTFSNFRVFYEKYIDNFTYLQISECSMKNT
jgi:hypothetical protein